MGGRQSVAQPRRLSELCTGRRSAASAGSPGRNDALRPRRLLLLLSVDATLRAGLRRFSVRESRANCPRARKRIGDITKVAIDFYLYSLLLLLLMLLLLFCCCYLPINA